MNFKNSDSMKDELSIKDVKSVTDAFSTLSLSPNLKKGIFLPRNIYDPELEEFLYDDSWSSLRKRLNVEAPDTFELLTKESSLIHERSADWTAPTLFVAWSLWSNHPKIVDVYVGILVNYLSSFLFRKSAGSRVKVSLICENKEGACRQFTYEGSPEGLNGISKGLNKALGDFFAE